MPSNRAIAAQSPETILTDLLERLAEAQSMTDVNIAADIAQNELLGIEP